MKKVVSISLNGIAFQLEEPGYDELHAYLERADARLKDSPDRAEVMADLEQAIGEKCARALGPHKTVVSSAEISSILAEMGPVESAEEAPPDAAAGSSASGASPAPGPLYPPPPRKRLFKIREGEMWTGVCNGIAAYVGVDPTWVRIAVVLLTVFTSGVVILIYFALAFIVPYAQTSEDRAAAFGAPFSTEEFLGRAKKKFGDSVEREKWSREWRRQQRQWRRQWHQMNGQMRQMANNASPQVNQVARAAGSVFLPIAALIGAVLFVGFILGMIELIAEHSIFGWYVPHGIPTWVAIIGLVMTYFIAANVVRALRHGGFAATQVHPGWNALHAVLWLGFTALLLWVAYTFVPGLRETADQLLWAANLTIDNISETIN